MNKLSRIFKIIHVFLYYRLYELIPSHKIPFLLKALIAVCFWYPKTSKKTDSAHNLRIALEHLGPVWIKLGQMLSTRKDLLSEQLSIELTKLQDQVTPFATSLVLDTICQELNITQISDVFFKFDEQPIATASMAQVHGAQIQLPDESQPISVIIKVIRPNIEHQIKSDISLMLLFAKFISKTKDAHRFRAVEVVREYEKTILNELNLKLEASNGIRLRDNFADSDDLYIPKIYPDLSTQKILVMERIYGIPVSDTAALLQQGSDLKNLAERGVRVFFTQVFRDSFFHADMHPGNIFIEQQKPNDPEYSNPKYIGIDFGIMGTLNEQDKRYLAENFVAFFNRNYLRVAQLHVQSGWVPSHINVEEFEIAIRAVCDPIFNKPLDEISFAQVLIGLFDTARQFEMEVQPQLVLLQKTLLYVEGLGRQLYPQLDLWQTAKPFLEQWVKEQMGFKAFFKSSKENLPYWLEKAPEIPEILHSGLTTLNNMPQMKQELIEQYLEHQKQHRRFLLQLTLVSCGFITSLLIVMFGNLDSLIWQLAVGVAGSITMLNAVLVWLKIR
ncbi:ubiquinone biosynthesis regulatory protein kinase UbiB [Psychrosphaera saromensis]|uniref:Ubiquinone biosynthesis regulatory protein kinase UbiB n=1 Tax=Psychrosphaera saromensis TaxID=716813 RepID=A0A2S7USZ9_9GAMM|nr:ubiquinone biosynthesis regulatory protein kinase UbiB [Psychrosphaera saromensis]PQJ52869.1 ubiquinone biosynthesis regulatory protein kinase UbiB [Psychrosphaera saromensis]